MGELRFLPPRPAPPLPPEEQLAEIDLAIRVRRYESMKGEVEAGRQALRSWNPLRWRRALSALVRVASDPRE